VRQLLCFRRLAVRDLRERLEKLTDVRGGNGLSSSGSIAFSGADFSDYVAFSYIAYFAELRIAPGLPNLWSPALSELSIADARALIH
jgi:hypothetical protein